MSASSHYSFDIFLSHNSNDKPVVRELKQLLESEGLSVWLDEDELRPGLSWQKGLDLGIRQSRAVAVLVGSDGMGPWEEEECEIALTRAVNMGWPVIPVLLPNAPMQPSLPATLASRTWIDLRHTTLAEGVRKVIWGVTGRKTRSFGASAGNIVGSAKRPGRRFSARLNCFSREGVDFLHARAAMLVTQVCRAFGDETTFQISLPGTDKEYNPKDIEFLEPLERFDHGIIVNVCVQGKMAVIGSAFFLTVWEGLDGHSEDSQRVKLELAKKLEVVCERVVDHDLTNPEEAKTLLDRIPFVKEARATPQQERFRAVETINDIPHKLTFPAVGQILKHFGCQLSLAFELGEQGVYSFEISSATKFQIDNEFYNLKVGCRVRFTMVVSGRKRNTAGPILVQFFKNLRQCDDWLRRRHMRGLECDVVEPLLDFLRGVRQFSESTTSGEPFSLSALLSPRAVSVNAHDQVFTKATVIEQLVAAHARLYELPKDAIMAAIKASENLQNVVSNQGVAILHVALKAAPRISISFGVYPSGVHWAMDEKLARLVVLVVYAEDTAHCWHDCFKRLGGIFHLEPVRADQLVEASDPENFVRTLRRMEEDPRLKQ